MNERTALRRHKERGAFDEATVYAILDEAFICHAACEIDGTVYMIPTAYGRDGDRLLLHGAAANHVLKAATRGAELTVTVTLVDGLVLARSTFHHSINYRSVVIYASATEITARPEKAEALNRIVEHMLPGRASEARQPTETELQMTRVVWIPLDEVSAKIRTGGPIEDDEDRALPVWGGVIPLRQTAYAPQPDDANPPDRPAPSSAVQPNRWGGPGGRA